MAREAHELLDGSRPIPIDRITYELAQNIILAFDNNENINMNNKDVQIEIEARVGLVVDKNKNRLKLPTNTDAIVESSYSDFQSGVDKDSFEYLLNYLHSITQRKKVSMYTNNSGIMSSKNELLGGSSDDTCITNIGRSTTSYTKESGGIEIASNFNDKENDLYNFVPLKTVRSVDKYYILSNTNTRIRVTTYLNNEDKRDNENMVKSLHKENLNTWNVYLGNNHYYFDEDDDEEEEEENGKNNLAEQNGLIDYRISINLEHTKPISKLFLSKILPVHERIKERTTFINKYLGIQLDLTKIKAKNLGGSNSDNSANKDYSTGISYNNNMLSKRNSSGNGSSIIGSGTSDCSSGTCELYEIEIEMPAKSILKAISNLRNKKDSNYLHFICSNLVNNIRGICNKLSHFRKTKSLSKQPNDNSLPTVQVNYIHPLKEKIKFQKYIHSVLPLIGDYMYRVVSKNEKNIHTMLNNTDISNTEKINIFKDVIHIRRHNKKSLMPMDETYAENKWKIVKKDGLKNEIVLVSEASDSSEVNDVSEAHETSDDEQEPELNIHDRKSITTTLDNYDDQCKCANVDDLCTNENYLSINREQTSDHLNKQDEENFYHEKQVIQEDTSKYQEFYDDT
ncbi:mRNA-capping enzyme subunit beta, putative [Plasmodium malariae]|uniref:mRNA 5'-phosphatase n=1 Tax=Plasmodium malariae TaxID=5858 RepID=A0A1A8VYX9_PLAMA|nr:mRNA-capping enzyme subunit beta, putative [Plasmodium malariae]SBS84581.1 mRNA capping enzyme [Plasmodium malariae]SCN12215.1 mRNA-capping enzyme subunit beta, putative [Plasmodium malariae]